MGTNSNGRLRAATSAAYIMYAALNTAPASEAPAPRILEAVDDAELSAQVAAGEVSRIALLGDRIARVIRSPGGFEAEHDPVSGDLYLRPVDRGLAGEETEAAAPATLFLGTEKGFTYRLTLTPAEGGPAQVLIRNPHVHPRRGQDPSTDGDPRISAIAVLIGAAARREPVAGYSIETGSLPPLGGFDVLEVWRGARFTAVVVDLGRDGPADAAALAARLGPGIAAVWVAEVGAGNGPGGGRLAVAVRENPGGTR